MTSTNRFNKNSVFQTFILAGIMTLFVSPSWAQDDQSDETDAADEQATEAPAALDKVVVTGSRIARTDVEGPSPVIVMTSEQIEQEGFTTVNEALQTLTQNVNFGQTEADGGTFTQNANAVDLRGLGPGRTLILFNGRRAADYPLPFNSQSNLVNLSAIPAAAVERIEVLSGGASAIYGSDAVAGVINVIMKTDVEGIMINARYGDTTQGGGQSARVQLTGGWQSDNDRFKIVYAAEYYQTDPIWAHERSFMDSLADNPDVINGLSTVTNTRTGLILDGFDQDGDGLVYVDPGAAACDALPQQEYSFRAGSGYYCGRADDISQFTLRSERENISIYTNVEFELSDSTQLFGNFSYWNGKSEFTVGTPFWFSEQLNGQYFVNTNGPDEYGIGGRLDLFQRIYSLEEIGGENAAANKFKEEAVDIAVGVRGTLFNDRYDYELTYSHAQYDLDRKRPLQLRAAVDDYFYGPDLGEGIFGYRMHAGDQSRIYGPMDAATWASITDTDHTVADSSNDQFTFVLSGDLFELPAGPVQFAAVAEWATQDYDIQLDSRFGETDNDGNVVRPNEWWGFTATGGGGSRDRYALGVEFSVPIFDSLRATLASRYDKYDDITQVDDAVTYNAGLEWRPVNNLLIRGSFATSFRAPDMHYIYKEPSGSYTSVTDEYRCRRDEPGVPLVDCTIPSANIFSQSVGNPYLKEEEGQSYTFGFVWEIVDSLSVSVDYYDIELEDMVGYITNAYTLETEADCRLGATTGGEPVDSNSLECQDVFNRITRNPINGIPLSDEVITQVNSGPINRAFQHTAGIDASLNYALNTDRLGLFALVVGYTHTLEQEGNEFAGDPIENQRDNLQIFDWRSKVRASLTWTYKDFTTTVFGNRTGSLPNWAETGRTGSHAIYNWTGAYSFTQNQTISVIVQNVGDTEPYKDETFNSYPYFLFQNFNPTGREWFVQYAISFGQ